VQSKILKLEIATAGLVVKLKKAMMSEMAMPPPPTPATVQSPIMKANTKTPMISILSVGNTLLWSQTPA
jgi:hypothetical protein